MKRFITIALLVLVAVVSCKKFDDSKIWEELKDHENRIALLEELCKKLNSDIINLQTIVTALETNDYIINASPLATGDGYTFLFKSGKSIVVYNGKDGSNGSDGKDGKDGVTPQIGVKKDSDGIYYWTVNGEWLLVDGEKVKASPSDGKNGITPQLKIDNDYWYISYDNGNTWEQVGKATGENGVNGVDGKSFFKSVKVEEDCVEFVLNDDKSTIIRIPIQKDVVLEVTLEEAGTLRSLISSDEKRKATKLIVKGVIDNTDMMFVQNFSILRELDLSEATYSGNSEEDIFLLNPYREELINRTLCKVWMPKLQGQAYACYSHCLNLEHIVVPCQDTYNWSKNTTCDMAFCPMLHTLEYSEGVINIPKDSCYDDDYYSHSYYNDKSMYTTVILPSTVQKVDGTFLRYSRVYKNSKFTYEMRNMVVTCLAVSPPEVELQRNTIPDYYTYKYTNCTLFVPSASVDAYKGHSIWGEFNVLPIQE